MNSLANGKIIEKLKFKKIFIPPAPGDSGGAIGAAILLLGENLVFSQSLGVAVILLALILPSVPSGRLGFNSSKN